MAKLTSIRLPDGSRYLRPIPKAKREDADFVASFDQHTLFYDVFFDEGSGLITAIGPSLKLQRRFFNHALFKVDGVKAEDVKVNLISPRTGEVTFKSPTDAPETLRLMHRAPPKLNVQVPINRSNHRKFEGKNALVAISKNNDLSWIKDWLAYYVAQHGANAVVLIDNGSEAYSMRDLRRAVISVKGIEAVELLSAPFPFGPKGVDRRAINAKFFHLSMLHIANRRFLAKANAVLSVDIDELVTRPDGRTVFEAVKGTPRGFLSIPGSWRYAKRPGAETGAIRHADHVLKRIGQDDHMQPKWCLDPTGPLAGVYWRVHGVLGEDRFFDHDFEYLHCRQITTNWDYARDFEPEDRFEPAPEAEMLGQIFNGQ